ncbi:MAG: glycoside hydrolase family 13 protein [Bacillota bacterium]
MDNIEAYHNSFDQYYRNPFGAVKIKESIRIRINIKSSQKPDQVMLIMEDDFSSEKHEYEMSEIANIKTGLSTTMNDSNISEKKNINEDNINLSSDLNHIYEVKVSSGDNARLFFYHMCIKIDGKDYYYGKKDDGLGGEGCLSNHLKNSYQLTVYKGNDNPTWFSSSIVYQIFVDRFFNGNEENRVLNPKKNTLIQSHWDNKPLYVKNEKGHVIRWDFFGGNLEGVRKKLSYLKDLGISVIYFNPIFQAASNHKYDTGDYHKIDEMFGDNQLFKNLVEEADEMGIKIILDGVFSHTGIDSIYFNKYDNYDSVGAYQSKESPYYSWYRFSNHPEDYESWWGISDLPNVNEMDPGYQDFIIYNKNSVLNHWMDAGIMGWRFDVADELPDQFIKNFKKEMRNKKKDSILIGEVWEDASNKSSYSRRREYFMGEELDSVTNYPFRKILIDFILGRIDSRYVHNRLLTLAENYPLFNFYSLLNLLGTHDVPRILTELSRDHQNACNYDVYTLAVRRLKLLSLWQMTFPGVPCIYYGDEVGLEGEEDPDNRRTYPWGNENQEILKWYQKVIALRKSYHIYSTGEWHSIYFNKDVYGYLRIINNNKDVFKQKKPNNTSLILFNRNINKSYELDLNFNKWFKDNKKVYDYFEECEVKLEDDFNRVIINPISFKLYIANLN